MVGMNSRNNRRAIELVEDQDQQKPVDELPIETGEDNAPVDESAMRWMIDPSDHPQKGRDAEKPGEYNLVIRVLTPEVNPGDTIHMEVYITGYGMIRGPKFTFTPPPNFLDEDESRLIHGFVRPEEGKSISLNVLEFGGDEAKLSEVSFVIRLAGITGYFADDKDITWKEPSIFWDTDVPPEYQTPMVATEMKRGRAVVEIYLKTKKRLWWGDLPFLRSEPGIYPGTHGFQGHLTYFNGEQWKSSSQSVSVVVPNFFKRHEGITWVAAILGVLIAVAGLLAT
jgi:hypothetical protein